MPVSFDTMILIWGVKKKAHPDQQDMIPRAERFLQYLDERGERVLLPADVLAEYLGNIPPEQRAAEQHTLLTRFPIVPLDTRAAIIAAELAFDKELWKKAQAEYQVTRQVVKSDISIIAESVAAGAHTLYSHDSKMQKLAQGKLLVKEIPTHEEMQPLGPPDPSKTKEVPGTLFPEETEDSK